MRNDHPDIGPAGGGRPRNDGLPRPIRAVSGVLGAAIIGLLDFLGRALPRLVRCCAWAVLTGAAVTATLLAFRVMWWFFGLVETKLAAWPGGT